MAHMHDYTLTFTDEDEAFRVLWTLGFVKHDDNQDIIWDESRVSPGVLLITVHEVRDRTVRPSVGVTPQQTIPGFHMAIALFEDDPLRDELDNLSNRVLRMARNRNMATKTTAFHQYAVRTRNMPEGIATDTRAEHVERSGGEIQKVMVQHSYEVLGSNYPDPL